MTTPKGTTEILALFRLAFQNREIWINGRPPRPIPPSKPALAVSCQEEIEVLAHDFAQVLSAVLGQYAPIQDKALEFMNKLFTLLHSLVDKKHVGYIIIDDMLCDGDGDFTFHYILYG